MRKIFLLFRLFTLSTTFACAQDYAKTKLGVKAHVHDMQVEIQFFSPDIVRILKCPENTHFIKESLSVVKTPETVDLDIAQQGNILSVQSKSLKVNFDFQTGKVFFMTPQGKNLLAEKEYGTQFTPVKDAQYDSYAVRQAFMLDKDEIIYGLGQQQTDRINQRNQKVFLRQRALHIAIPYIASVKGYGLFWDNYSPTMFTDNSQETAFDSETGECADYYFLYGSTGDGTVRLMRQLTGQAPMYPLWSLGFWQSRERYKSQAETLETVEKYRALRIPLDGIIQDWQYWGNDSNWNSMSFDNPEFPDPKAMIDRIHKLNAHIMISVWASFGPNTRQLMELRENKMLIDIDTWPPDAGVKPYDPYNPQARDIYWKYMSKLFALGIDAWWLDSTEPDHLNIKERDFDQPTHLGTFRSVRNAFPLMTTKGVYEHQRAETSDKRVYILTRCAFAGQQRYAANSWSGDVVATWDVFRRQIPTGLNFSLCGIPYWNTDIGGFFLNQYTGEVNNRAYHELYSRWFQFGTFTPMTRSHGSGVKKEIYQFGSRGDWAFDNQEKYINLRYRLLPYLYSTAWDVTSRSGSFMRPLFMDFNDDKNVQEIGNQYMFGKSFMVIPVTEPMYVKSEKNKWANPVEDFKNIGMQKVYLPAGTSWYDFWTGEKLAGGQTVQKQVPIDIIPLYIRSGTILPLGPKVQYATEKPWDELEIRIYGGADGEFVLYEDENDNYNYEKGAYATIRFAWNDATNTLTVEDRKGEFPGMLKKRKFNVVKVEPGVATGIEAAKRGKTVSYEGAQMKIAI